MISSMDLFFSRDCADGAGPAVEAASPLWAALPPAVPLAAPKVEAGCDSALGFDAGASLPEGLLNRLGVVVEVVAAPEAAGAAELPPPKLGNSDVPDDAVEAGAVVVAVVAAPVVAGVLVAAAGLPNPKPLPVEAGVEVPAVENRLVAVPAEAAVLLVFPPKLKVGVPLDAGCEEAGCADDVAPRVNPDGFAGAAAGVVLPRLKRLPAGLGVFASCPLDVDV